MNIKLILILITFSYSNLIKAQGNTSYMRMHSVQIENQEYLNDSVYQLLSPFQFIMIGETHGTHESAQFARNLIKLYTAKGDSVQLGLEIPSSQMDEYIKYKNDNSIYQSTFFKNPPQEDGRESEAWADLISESNQNPNVQIFFFDINITGNGRNYRDSMMYIKIKNAIEQYPHWKMITLSGNYHNRIVDENTMCSFLLHDKELNIASKICSLNTEYLEGSCTANFGRGLEYKQLGHPPGLFDDLFSSRRYICLVSPNYAYDYSGFFYTRYITSARMIKR